MKPERRAIILLLGLAVGGQGLRAWLAAPGTPPGEVSLIPAPAGSTPLAHRDSGLALAKPLAPGEKVDLDRAPALEIARLPRVGLKLAKVIVSDRNARGPFGSLEAFDRVPGIGPGLLATIRDQARFSALPVSPDPVSAQSGAAIPIQAQPGNAERGTRPSALGSAERDPARGSPSGRNVFPIIPLNTATAAELERLPKVGPALAARIVAFRQKHGPFPVVDSLVRVPGIGPATLALLRDKLRVE